MKIISFILLAFPIFFTTLTNADTSFVSIPASAFTGQNSEKNVYTGNLTGTTREFTNKLFAPVNIPHKATVTLFKCAASSPTGVRTVFRLRRNEPQQENVNIITLKTSLDGNGFEFLSSVVRDSRRIINNKKYNYYIVAEAQAVGFPPNKGICNTSSSRLYKCSVTSCTIEYSITNSNSLKSTTESKK